MFLLPFSRQQAKKKTHISDFVSGRIFWLVSPPSCRNNKSSDTSRPRRKQFLNFRFSSPDLFLLPFSHQQAKRFSSPGLFLLPFSHQQAKRFSSPGLFLLPFSHQQAKRFSSPGLFLLPFSHQQAKRFSSPGLFLLPFSHQQAKKKTHINFQIFVSGRIFWLVSPPPCRNNKSSDTSRTRRKQLLNFKISSPGLFLLPFSHQQAKKKTHISDFRLW